MKLPPYIRLCKYSPRYTRANALVASILEIIDGLITILTVGIVRTNFCLAYISNSMKNNCKKEKYKDAQSNPK